MSSVKGSTSPNMVSAPTTIKSLGWQRRILSPIVASPDQVPPANDWAGAHKAPRPIFRSVQFLSVFSGEHIDQRGDGREVVAGGIGLFVQRRRLIAQFRAGQRP
jgi:hypothetical protein